MQPLIYGQWRDNEMNQKTRYTFAGLIFIGLLLHRLYGIGQFVLIWIRHSPYTAWSTTGHRQLSSFWLCVHAACVVLTIYPLIYLIKDSFKGITNQKNKVKYTCFYAVGVLVPWAVKFRLNSLDYLFSRYALSVIRYSFLPVIFVVIFGIAVFALMQTEKEQKMASIVTADNNKLKHYKDMLDQGIISKNEFEEMKKKIESGKL